MSKKCISSSVEIVPSLNQSWAFTFKKLGRENPTHDDYVPVIEVLQKYGLITHSSFERDSKGKIHVHGIVQLRKGFFRKRLEVCGFHLKLVEIYDQSGWESYINKNQMINNNDYMF